MSGSSLVAILRFFLGPLAGEPFRLESQEKHVTSHMSFSMFCILGFQIESQKNEELAFESRKATFRQDRLADHDGCSRCWHLSFARLFVAVFLDRSSDNFGGFD